MENRSFSRIILSCLKFKQRVAAKLFAFVVGGSFNEFGKHSVMMMPVRLSGENRIAIGDDVYIGAGSWLQALDDGDNTGPAL